MLSLAIPCRVVPLTLFLLPTTSAPSQIIPALSGASFSGRSVRWRGSALPPALSPILGGGSEAGSASSREHPGLGLPGLDLLAAGADPDEAPGSPRWVFVSVTVPIRHTSYYFHTHGWGRSG